MEKSFHGKEKEYSTQNDNNNKTNTAGSTANSNNK